MKLTNAQIYTLRRLSGGSKYQLRGDGKKARECRPGSGIFTDDISAPSIPVLFRLGLVDYVPRFYVSTSKSIIKALINMHSFEIQLSPIG